MSRRPAPPAGPDPAALPGGKTQLNWPSLAERQRFEAIATEAIKRYGKLLAEKYGEPVKYLRERAILSYLNDLVARDRED